MSIILLQQVEEFADSSQKSACENSVRKKLNTRITYHMYWLCMYRLLGDVVVFVAALVEGGIYEVSHERRPPGGPLVGVSKSVPERSQSRCLLRPRSTHVESIFAL